MKTHAAGGGVEKNDDCFGLPLAAAQEELDSTFFLARFDLSVPLRLWAETGSRNRAAETSERKRYEAPRFWFRRLNKNGDGEI